MRILANAKIKSGDNDVFAYQEAASEVLTRQIRSVAIPRAISLIMREVWSLQPRLERTTGVRPYKLLGHPRFRAAYDFLVLRAETGEADQELAEWWTRFQSADEAQQRAMTREGGSRTGTRKTRVRKRGPRKPKITHDT